MWFNRKSTAFQQAIEKIEVRLDAFERRLDRQLATNKADLLEFAELSEKTRRLYLRLTRRAKIASEATSNENEEIEQNAQPQPTAREVRDSINRNLGV